jgi:hypothetical protein
MSTRQHFQGLRRAQNKIETIVPAIEGPRHSDPSENPITRRPGPGRGRPRKQPNLGSDGQPIPPDSFAPAMAASQPNIQNGQTVPPNSSQQQQQPQTTADTTEIPHYSPYAHPPQHTQKPPGDQQLALPPQQPPLQQDDQNPHETHAHGSVPQQQPPQQQPPQTSSAATTQPPPAELQQSSAGGPGKDEGDPSSSSEFEDAEGYDDDEMPQAKRQRTGNESLDDEAVLALAAHDGEDSADPYGGE